MMGRWPAAAIFLAGGIALFAVLVRISYSVPVNSDAANNALQAWDMLHGNLLLHGWIIGDATYYTFELPLYAIADGIFGLSSVVPHVVSAFVYILIAACALSLARTGSRGMPAALRSGIVLAMMSVPLLLPAAVSILIEKPDHTGTTAIALVSFLVIERALSRKFAAPLLCAILIAGQLSDATVLYVTVPTIALVSAYRVIAARKIRIGDTAMLAAAAVSVPLAMLLRSAIVSWGGFLMIAPRTQIAPFALWARNFHLTLASLRLLFGTLTGPHGALGAGGAALGYACAAAAIYGFGRVIWTWRTASRAEQLLCVAIVVNIAAYMFSTLPVPSNSRELAAVLPCGAILAARALVRDRTAIARHAPRAIYAARAALAGLAAATLLPLAAAAAKPADTPAAVPLAAWLEAHGLKYGVAAYWNASAVTLVSGDRVQVRAVYRRYFGLSALDWESNWTWYYPRAHDATFVIANGGPAETHSTIPVAEFEQFLGKPASMHQVAGQVVMIYNRNVLLNIAPALPIPGTPRPGHHKKHKKA